MKAAYVIQCPTREIFRFVEAAAISAGYYWGLNRSTTTRVDEAYRRYGSEVCLYLYDDRKSLAYGPPPMRVDVALLDPRSDFEAVVNAIYGESVPALRIAGHEVKFDAENKVVQVGCMKILFREVRDIHGVVASFRLPISIVCNDNEVVFRGVESILQSAGCAWSVGELDRGRLCVRLIAGTRIVSDPGGKLQIGLAPRKNEIDPLSETFSTSQLLEQVRGQGVRRCAGRKVEISRADQGVFLLDEGRRTAGEVASFDEVEELYQAVEKLEKKEE
jgi:hypothetical protein